jgi:hypothetical protein
MHQFEAAPGYRLADMVWFGVTKRARQHKGLFGRYSGILVFIIMTVTL